MVLRRKQIMASGIVTAAILGASLYVGCGGMKDITGEKDKDSSTGEESSQIVLTGQLALTGTPTTLALVGETPAIGDLDLYCVTFQLPPVAGTGDIGDDGKFELTLEAKDTSVGCFILKSQEVLATLVFEDPTKKDMAGGSKSSERFGFAGGRSNLGNIVLDLATGKAVVDVSKIVSEKTKDTAAAAAQAVDFTGSYKFTSAGIDLPTGYSGACVRSESGERQDKDCRGPSEGEKLWLKTVTGTDVASGQPAHGLMIWQSEELFNTCGKKLGFSYEDGKRHGIDLTSSGVSEGQFDWDPALEEGWKDVNNARANNSVMKMERVTDFHGYAGTKQYFKQYRQFNCNQNGPCQEGQTPTVAAGFQFNADSDETGCKDPDGKPVRIDNWSNMTCENTDLGSGLHKNICSKTDTTTNTKVTCTNISGTYSSAEAPIANVMVRFPEDFNILAWGAYCDYNKNKKFDGDEWPQWQGDRQSCRDNTAVTPGQLCKNISTADDESKLAQLRCFLEANNQNTDDQGGACRREVRANWNAQTPDEFFASAEGPARAQGQHIMELFTYDSPTSGSLRGEEREFTGIQVGNNWTDCEVISVFNLSVRQIEGTADLLAEMSQSEKNVSTKPACIAEFGDEGKTMKFMFKMQKQ